MVVIGLGRFGGAVANSLMQLGHDVMGIDRDPEPVHEWADLLTHAVQADSTNAMTMRQLGVADFSHAIVGIGGTTIDVTDQVRAEREQKKLEEQLAQAQKMESIGRLAGGVAHDFNNMLQTILGFTDLALAQLPAGHPVRADVEEIDRAARVVGVVNGEQGSTIIAASYEARAVGIRTGTPWAEARARCPEFVRVVSRPARYSEISSRIMTALQEVTPELEVFSVDEAFLDLTSCQAYYRYQPETIGRLIRATVLKVSGLSCSVGISGDKTTAK